ncbi:20S-pre-rRNA D-site endonuclease nob1 [Coemansia javaensis]|uniref:20S-pre-rRNA D-site endonuclease NOB1 n=1 Tax=Coemansia javaensis TaxID=2761396 RepID=A0A9W8HBT1_9FUNG|nr:20S-pre-rRNA D-site endonuclease nob1 [Coemansia javaensis]
MSLSLEEAGAGSGRPVRTLVVDTNVFIKGLRVEHIGDEFVTVAEVVQELSSKRSRDQYEDLRLRRGVQVLAPDAESIQAVVGFAKKTGDFSALALADLKVLALAFMLEKRVNGMANLRLEPASKGPQIPGRKPQSPSQTKAVDPASSGVQAEEDAATDGLEQQLGDLALGAEADAQEEEDVYPDVLQSVDNSELDGDAPSEAPVAALKEEDDDDGWTVAKPKGGQRAAKQVDEFFNGEWITPKNIKQRQAADATGLRSADTGAPSVLAVACVTSDFAMQNVMLGMGINLVTCDGVRVRQLRTWVLRCHACCELTGDMSRQFCSACGHATLKRCPVTAGTDGRLHVHLRANYNHNLRGTVYSIPKPRGGRHTAKDVITREHDPAYTRAMRYKKRADERAASGADLLADPDFDPGALVSNPLAHAKGFGVATDARGMPMVARNRRNPNIVRTTGNRKKKRSHV